MFYGFPPDTVPPGSVRLEAYLCYRRWSGSVILNLYPDLQWTAGRSYGAELVALCLYR